MEYDDILPCIDDEQLDWETLLNFDDVDEQALMLHNNTHEEQEEEAAAAANKISEIEKHLMTDDESQPLLDLEAPNDFVQSFLADILVDDTHSPSTGSGQGEVLDDPNNAAASSDDNASPEHNNNNNKQDNINIDNNNNNSPPPPPADADAAASTDADANDSVFKKRRRQLRNRDAAVRSRERKKMYVKDLETKSRYLEAECRRLSRLLQCCYTENHSLRYSLQMSNASGASMAKQESAVLLLELLLLGSLLWFLGTTCLLILPAAFQATLLEITLESKGNRGLENQAPKKEPGIKMVGIGMPGSYLRSRRCRASRTKMKSCLVLPVSA